MFVNCYNLKNQNKKQKLDIMFKGDFLESNIYQFYPLSCFAVAKDK